MESLQTPATWLLNSSKGWSVQKIDQYAFGCIAYELFAGRHPYNLRGANASVAEYQHSNVEPVVPSTYNPQLPAYIETAIQKAMAKDRNNRYSNIAAFLAALQQQTAFSQPPTQPVISQPLTVPVTLRPSASNQPNILSQTPPDAIEQLFQEGEQEIAKQERIVLILTIIIGTGILLGIVGEGVRAGAVVIVIGAVQLSLTGAMIVGAIAGMFAVLAEAIKNEDKVLIIGAWVVVLVAGLGGGIVAGLGIVDDLELRIIFGIIEGGICALAAIIVYCATIVVYKIAYGIAKVVGVLVALIDEAREKP